MRFMGEMMECAICGKRQKSDLDVESGWTVIELDNVAYYVCPSHIGNPKWTASQHKEAYTKVLRKLTSPHTKRMNGK